MINWQVGHVHVTGGVATADAIIWGPKEEQVTREPAIWGPTEEQVTREPWGGGEAGGSGWKNAEGLSW